jgi:TBC1 domain family member 5
MQDNFFFREPETQRMLLDILFIYSKLNPDIGYRQGMHELLAPLLWVVHQDAVDHTTVTTLDRQAEGVDLMLDILDHRHREADAFSLFCAVMQTAKSFYEMGDNRDSSPIIAKSRRIHEDLLATFDPDLALHLQVAGVLPQIYAIRWIRLLFGREFDFKDLLRLWDILFAEKLRSDIIDMTCVAMLLRVRWTLIEADYSTAITSLTHLKLPETGSEPRGIVRDAILLDKNRTNDTGADLVQRYSGRRPRVQDVDRPRVSIDQTPTRRESRTPQYRASPSASPARFNGPQRQLESLFQDVSGGLRSRAEGWNVSKAVRGAVGEVRRNMSQLQVAHSRQSSVDTFAGSGTPQRREAAEIKRLERKVGDLEARNKALSRMLDGALDALRRNKDASSDSAAAEETFNISLAKIQFVSVYLSDPEIPIPAEDTRQHENDSNSANGPEQESVEHVDAGGDKELRQGEGQDNQPETTAEPSGPDKPPQPQATPTKSRQLSPSPIISKSAVAPSPRLSPAVRPSLADSSFSFMLGEGRHRSSFVSSATNPPEERRNSDANSKARPGAATVEAEAKGKSKAKDRKGSNSESKKDGPMEADDGFTMSSLRGGGDAGPL